MKTKLKIFLFSALCLLSMNFFACKTDVDEEKTNTEQKPSDDNKTYLQVSNNSQFDINVYFQSPSYSDPWATIKVGESEKKEISASTTNAGDGIYIQYLYPMGNIVIPYYDARNSACIQVKQIVEKEVNSIKVSPLSSLTMDTKYLIIKNESDADIALYNGTSPVTPLYQEKYWITSGNYRIYELGSNSMSSLDNYKLGNGIVNKELGIQGMEQGNIYTVRYTNASVDLLSVTPIDISAKEKIWQIPLSQKNGKYLSADKFCVCDDVSDGYVFTGQISYNKNFYDEESSPYIAEISPSGEVFDAIFSFKDSPQFVKSNQIIEENGMRIVAGVKTNSDGEKVPFIYGEKNCDFYIEPSIDNFYIFNDILYKGNNVFALLYEFDNDFGIFELNVKSYSDTEGKIVYSGSVGLLPQGFIHSNEEYVVMAQEDGDSDTFGDKTKFLFISDSNFEITGTLELDKYLFNSIICTPDKKFAFASGSYLNSKSGKDTASFMKIDLEKREFCYNGTPKLFPATDNNLHSNFSSISIKNDEIFLAGFIDRNYTRDWSQYSSGFPYLVSYDVESDKVNWSQTYNDKKYCEFEISSCYLSAIGTPLILIHNSKTGMAYLASCGLLGEIPEAELESLPRNTKITDLKIPYIYITVVDANHNFHKLKLQNETSISFDDIKNKLGSDFNIPDDKIFVGYQIETSDGNFSDVVFPYVTNGDVYFYAKYEDFNAISDLRFTSYTASQSPSFTLIWSPVNNADYYTVYYKTREGNTAVSEWKNAGDFTDCSVTMNSSGTVLNSSSRVVSANRTADYYFKVIAHNTKNNKETNDSNELHLHVDNTDYPCACTIEGVDDMPVTLLMGRAGSTNYIPKWSDGKSYYLHLIFKTTSNGEETQQYWSNPLTSGSKITEATHKGWIRFYLSSSSYPEDRVSNYVTLTDK